MSDSGQQRRECREPHTFLESTYLERSTSPRLNNLTQESRRGRNNDTTGSSVFNRFSSVSPHQAGISYNSHSELYGSGGYFVPPPPPSAAGGVNVFPASHHTSNSVNWTLPPPAAAAAATVAAWAVPKDVPWIPPPLISPNGLPSSVNSSHHNTTVGASLEGGVKWPTPQDIPLPSMFPFPPYLLPPFPPLPPNVDLSQLPPPPPPPWFPSPLREPNGGVMEDDDYVDESSSSRDKDVDINPSNRKRMNVSYNKRYTREPSLSAQEQHHMRSITKEARRDLHRQLSRSVSADSQYKNNEIDQKRKQRSQPVRYVSPNGKRTATPRTTLSTAKRFTSPSYSRGTAATAAAMSAPVSKSNSNRRTDYYTAARAVKGVSPRLEDVMKKHSSAVGMRLENTSRGEGYARQYHRKTEERSGNYHHHHHDHNYEEKEKRERQFLSNLGDAHGTTTTPLSYHGSGKRDEQRAEEYVKGIEDLYKRLRRSYEEFQRDPSSFVRNTSALKEAANAMAPPLDSRMNDTHTHERKEKKEISQRNNNNNDEDRESTQVRDLGLPSQESQRIRDELLKLEMQWQRLEELKRGSTGEWAAAPVEFTPQNSRLISPQRESRSISAKSSNHSVNSEYSKSQRAKEQIKIMNGTLRRGSDLPHSTRADGVTTAKVATGIRSHNSTPLSQSDTLKGHHLDGTQTNPKDRNSNSSSNRGPFTRELVLGLVRERKAMLE
ncbi:uncharacterized protein TM35_000481490 [Trypanosoma theileri]|uniref:Uncharacterized protein n=1 Tax=Trypanosoma theileri TaxID=67003 RepID=A0A1X0NI39_9TRYP|nr:uncharacterized protein TM35_000481490 [Trypanosoma theileri]ORC84188.1 hypothetical protein TM35_000481490 [Trypanosoma theileri]